MVNRTHLEFVNAANGKYVATPHGDGTITISRVADNRELGTCSLVLGATKKTNSPIFICQIGNEELHQAMKELNGPLTIYFANFDPNDQNDDPESTGP